ncbi:MAG: alpha/beta fold hydrolase [Natronospirillum sp.]
MMKTLGVVAPAFTARLMVHVTTRPGRQVQPRHDAFSTEGEWVTFRFGHQALRWGTAGPVVVAMHGWQGHPDQFRFLGSRLASQGYQFFALNGPAHGADPNTQAHIGLFADYLQDVFAELGPVHTVIGHSFGAGAALLALSEGLQADRVVAIAAPDGVQTILENVATQVGLPAQARRTFMSLMERRVGYAVGNLQAKALLRNLTSPLLVVHDYGDRAVPFSDALEIHNAAAEAALFATAGLGHGGVLKSEVVGERIQAFIAHAETAAAEQCVSHYTVKSRLDPVIA